MDIIGRPVLSQTRYIDVWGILSSMSKEERTRRRRRTFERRSSDALTFQICTSLCHYARMLHFTDDLCQMQRNLICNNSVTLYHSEERFMLNVETSLWSLDKVAILDSIPMMHFVHNATYHQWSKSTTEKAPIIFDQNLLQRILDVYALVTSQQSVFAKASTSYQAKVNVFLTLIFKMTQECGLKVNDH